MSKEYIPTEVDAARFAENGTHLHGMLQVENMQRLASSLATPEGAALADIRFGIDDHGKKVLKGSVQAALSLVCQRCLEPFVYEVNSNFLYRIVGTDAEAKALPENYDPIIAVDDRLMIADMVEEELIVNLPIVSMHDPKNCKVKLPIVVVEDPAASAQAENPFKVIELLKVKPKESNKED